MNKFDLEEYWEQIGAMKNLKWIPPHPAKWWQLRRRYRNWCHKRATTITSKLICKAIDTPKRRWFNLDG